jgi:hypothetical protein
MLGRLLQGSAIPVSLRAKRGLGRFEQGRHRRVAGILLEIVEAQVLRHFRFRLGRHTALQVVVTNRSPVKGRVSSGFGARFLLLMIERAHRTLRWQ